MDQPELDWRASDSALLADHLRRRSNGALGTRARSGDRAHWAGTVVLGGTHSASTGRGVRFHRACNLTCWERAKIGFWTLCVLSIGFLAVAGGLFLQDIMAEQQQATTDGASMQQIQTLLQQMVAEQIDQRTRINELGAAVQASGQAVQGTQQVTETVVTEVVQQVQQTFQQSQQSQQDQMQQMHQQHQDQFQQISQAMQQEQQSQHGQIQQLAHALTGIQTQLQQQAAAIQSSLQSANATGNSSNATVGESTTGQAGQTAPHGSPPHPPSGGAANGPTGGACGATPGGVPSPVPPMPGGGSQPFNFGVPTATQQAPTVGAGSGPQMFNIGGGQGASPQAAGSPTGGMSAAVAYAIQQGAIDNRSLGKPQTFDPNSSKVSFQDWSDHIVTTCDGAMPGIYEILEWIMNTQPRVSLDSMSLKTRFPHVDPLLLDYAESNVFAILSTYTSGEAKSLVRQAKRPHGMEAWRLLQIRFNPNTIGRQRAHLIKITNPAEGVSIDKLGAEIVAWENRICDFESRPVADRVSDSVKMAAIVQMCPNKLREHLQLNAGRYTNYLEIREEVFSYLDHVQPSAATSMDVGSLQVLGCWNCGSLQHYAKNCPLPQKDGGKKGKGKGGKMDGKGKSGKDGGKKGKGKWFSKDAKGKQKGKSGKDGGGNKGQQTKSLNAMSTDPRLGQIQSAYAKAAIEAYNRERGVSSSPPVPQPPQPMGATPSTTSQTPAAPAQPIGGLVLKSLFALSQQTLGAIRRVASSSRDFVRNGELSWRLRQMLTGSYLVDATVDSGAAASVCPAETFSEYNHEQTDGTQHFVAANGDLVPELYRVKPVIATAEGLVRQTQFSVAGVSKVLVSAAQICNRGHRIVLDSHDGDSYIEDKSSGERMRLRQKDGVYVQTFAVVRPDNLGFSGLAPRVDLARL